MTDKKISKQTPAPIIRVTRKRKNPSLTQRFSLWIERKKQRIIQLQASLRIRKEQLDEENVRL